MKTKTWIGILGAVLVLCLGLSLWLLWPRNANTAEVWSDGQLVYTLPLDRDTTVTVSSPYGTSRITVQGGKIAVTEATCPDHYCMDRGYCSGGAQIVCLPNKMIIKFTGKQAVDGASG